VLNIRTATRKGFLLVSAVIIGVLLPLGTLSADSSTCTPPSSSTPGVTWPTGSDASTFTYICDASSPYYGEWTNAYYVFNPSTAVRTPLYSPDYNYDCTNDTWYMTQWTYSPAASKYLESQVATTAPSGLSTDCPVATGSSNADPTATSGANSSTDGTSDPSSDISTTGPNSDNGINTNSNNNVNDNNIASLGVTNNTTDTANSGNALVVGNTAAGDATSGNTQEEANIINMLQSSSNDLGNSNNIMTFTDNINGDVNGNLLLDPASLSSIQDAGPNSTNSTGSTSNNTLTVNNSTGEAINNNVNLDADSGNASVADNTDGGNATSGAAQNIANVVNMIDSAVTAGQSFIGTININGNLNGNIEVPADFVNELLADNVPTVNLTGPSSSNSSNTNVNNNSSVTNSNNQGISNTVNNDSKSGSASVSDNTSAGGATSGSADTNITAFNLTGSSVVGANDLLVFVNVVGGNWVGLIVNAPAGSTAAEIGGGISSSGPNSSNSSNTTDNTNSTLNNSANQQINNNITTNAKSGNASVDENTKGGNATSGNADSAVNLLNVENSSLNLSNWFGILFINVFGTWNGDFGTTADFPASTSNSDAATSGSFVAAPAMRFVPNGGSGTSTGNTSSPLTSYLTGTAAGSGIGSSIAGNSLLASSRIAKNGAPNPQLSQGHVNWLLVAGSGTAFVAYIFGERFYSIKQKAKQNI
jgi:hypothetical protein